MAGGVVEARCSRAVLRLARVVIPSRFIRAMSEGGWRWVPAFLPVNSHLRSARVLVVPNGLVTGSAVISASKGGMSSSGSRPRVK